MRQFKITEKYYIKVYDENNWAIAYMEEPDYNSPIGKRMLAKRGGVKKGPKEKIWGFYRTLQDAKEASAELASKEAEDIEELKEIIAVIKSIEEK